MARPLLVALTGILFAGLLSATTGCDSFEIGGGAKHTTLTYTDDARAAYNEAMVPFRAREWEDAKVLFGEVKRLFAYSRYARLAELRLADMEYEQEKFNEANTAYREFVQNHRNDPDIEYARYRITRSLYRDIDDTIFLPPQEERDQATAAEAYREIRNFIRDYPKSRYNIDERYMFEVVVGRLVRHELYVARYYLRTEAFDATVARVDFALKAYKDSGLEPEALVLKGETFMKMKKLAEAKALFLQVKNVYGGPFVQTADRFLAEVARLEAKGAPPAPPPPPPADPADPANGGAAAPKGK